MDRLGGRNRLALGTSSLIRLFLPAVDHLKSLMSLSDLPAGASSTLNDRVILAVWIPGYKPWEDYPLTSPPAPENVKLFY